MNAMLNGNTYTHTHTYLSYLSLSMFLSYDRFSLKYLITAAYYYLLILLTFFSQLLEHKWIVRIVLQKINFGIGWNTTLRYIADDDLALELHKNNKKIE